MKKYCPICHKIHDSKQKCTQKRVYEKKNTEADRFRSSYVWKCKRKHIMQRDLYLCRVCLAEKRVNNQQLSVHHIAPLRTAPELALEDSNLITLCSRHHEQAEDGTLSAEYLRSLIPPQG